MPERDPHDIHPQAERLDRAIEQVLAGGSAPKSDDDLAELVQVAAQLAHFLPRDMPDPAFRLRLRDSLAQAAMPSIASARLPSIFEKVRALPVAAMSTAAAVLLLAAALGGYVIWGNNNHSPDTVMQVGTAPGNSTIANQKLATSTRSESASQVATLRTQVATEAVQITASVAIDPQPTASPMLGTTPATSTPRVVPTQTAHATTQRTTPTAIVPTRVATESPSTPVATSVPTQEISPPVQAVIPDVNAQTIEQGAVPAAEGGGAGPTSGVTFTLAASGDMLSTEGEMYRLAPPSAAPDTFCKHVAEKLAIGEAISWSDTSGTDEYFVGDPSLGTFHWVPATGVFQFSSAVTPKNESIDPAGVYDVAREWLATIGYPVDLLADTGTVEPFGEQWQLTVNYEAIPIPGLGRPIGTWMIVNPDGSIAEASGYWLTPVAENSVPLIDWNTAWKEIQRGAGYWLDGGMAAEGGSFTVEAVELSYVLTRGGQELVLQPAVKASGTFVAADGTSSRRIAVFVRAARIADATP